MAFWFICTILGVIDEMWQEPLCHRTFKRTFIEGKISENGGLPSGLY